MEPSRKSTGFIPSLILVSRGALQRMSFLKTRIQRDLDNLCVPMEFQLREHTLLFRVKIETEIYNGMYDFKIEFPVDYPFRSPKLFCTTAVFHPNIDKEGNVCLKVLREGWMPCYDINSIVVSLICCFHYPSGSDALNVEAGDILEQDYEEFVRIAKSVNAQAAIQEVACKDLI